MYDVLSRNSRGAGALNAPTASAGLDNIDQSLAFSNTLTLSSRTVNETRVQFAHGDLKALTERSHRTCGQHRGRCIVRHPVGKPAGPGEQDVSGREQSFASGGRARAARGCRFRLQRRRDHVSAIGSRRICVFVAREFSCRHIQRIRIYADLRRERRLANQSQRGCLRAGRVEGHSVADDQRRSSLRPAISADDSRPTRTTCLRASGLPGCRSTRGGWSCAAAAACSSTAYRCERSATRCLSAGNTTDLSESPADHDQSVAAAAGRARIPEHPYGSGRISDACRT